MSDLDKAEIAAHSRKDSVAAARELEQRFVLGAREAKAAVLHIPRIPGKCHRCGAVVAAGEGICPNCGSVNLNW